MKDYTGKTAEEYEKIRSGNIIWKRETETVQDLLIEGAPKNVLDVPVGTGRFFSIYDKLGIDCVGVDISKDMLVEARRKNTHYPLMTGDVFDLPFEDNKFDTTLCIRLLTWFNIDQIRKAANELVRVTKHSIICSVWLGQENRKRAVVANKEEEWNAVWKPYELSSYSIRKQKRKEYRIYRITL